ncbi:MAG: hypothetical protein Kow0056_13480 [Coriobacteriia bacterium]
MQEKELFSGPYSEILAAFIDDLVRREEAKACMGRLTGFYTDALPVLSDRLRENTERVTELERNIHFLRVSDPEDRERIEAERAELEMLLAEGDELIALMDPAARDWLPGLNDFTRAAATLWTWAALESYVSNTLRLSVYVRAVAAHLEKHPGAALTQTHRKRIHSHVKKQYESARRKGLPGVVEAFRYSADVDVLLDRETEQALTEARRLRNRIVHDSLQFRVGRDGHLEVTGARAREGDLISTAEMQAAERVCCSVMLAVDRAVTRAFVGPGPIDEAHDLFRRYFQEVVAALEDGPAAR